MMKLGLLGAASLCVIANLMSPAFAQSGQPADDTPPSQTNAGGGNSNSGNLNGDIIVTARRRDEQLQDVPLSVNAVTAAELAKLNVRRFEDISNLVPGLTLKTNANGQGTTSSVRGIAFDANASGTNPSVEFYLNDAIVTANALFQANFDVGQVEVLRGPQGTLRGRASPSGSITVTTHRPDLYRIGGYFEQTGTDLGAINANAAINVPIIPGMLAVRVAGLVDQNDGSRVRSIHNDDKPYQHTYAGRATVRFDPTSTVSIVGTYQRLKNNVLSFDQNESANLVDPTAATAPVRITADQRLSSQLTPRTISTKSDVYNLQASWAFKGQRLNYVGSYNKEPVTSFIPNDLGAFFSNAFPAAVINAGQTASTVASQQSHEVRLSSEERLFGLFDYVIGGFYVKDNTPVAVSNVTQVFLGAPRATPSNFLTNVVTPISTNNRSIEKSLFGNLTLHIGDLTELSGGVRYISYKGTESLVVNGNQLFNAADDFNPVIYTGTLKHDFSDSLMAYATVGSSFRPGLHIIGDFSLAQSPTERNFTNLAPEHSRSYEIGAKSTLLDRKLTLNVAAFHQTFENYPYRASAPQFYISTDVGATPGTTVNTVRTFNFVAPVPVHVDGAEVEVSYRASQWWSFGVSAAYAKSKIQNGVVPCNDYGGAVPTIAQINARAGAGNNLATCSAKFSASLSPDFTAVLQSEYNHPINGRTNAFVRGLLSFFGKSANDAANPVDDVHAYALLNLYAGIRDPKGNWEVSLFAKNLTKNETVLSRGSSPITTPYNNLGTGVAGVGGYRTISEVPARELGVNVRYAFGSH